MFEKTVILHYTKERMQMPEILDQVLANIAFRVGLKKRTIWFDEETNSYYRELPDGTLKRLTF